jgi:hypothetical protein
VGEAVNDDITTIERDGVTYEVVDGPFEDDWHQVYWLVTEPDGTEIILYDRKMNDDDEAMFHMLAKDGLRPKPRSLFQTVSDWWRAPQC